MKISVNKVITNIVTWVIAFAWATNLTAQDAALQIEEIIVTAQKTGTKPE